MTIAGSAANAQSGGWCRGTRAGEDVAGQVGTRSSDPEKNTLGFSCNVSNAATISSATAMTQRVQQVRQVGSVTGDLEKDTLGFASLGGER